VVRVGADTEMETFLSGLLDEVLVGADTGGLESLRAQLFVFIGDHMNAEREVIDIRLLSAEIEDTNLRVGNTTVEPGLGIRLFRDMSVKVHNLCRNMISEVFKMCCEENSVTTARTLLSNSDFSPDCTD
jgi:hypothetical protein